MAKDKKILIIGARGPVGWNVMEHFANNCPDWQVVGTSRRAPTGKTKADYICVDLLDWEATKTAFAPLKDVTHIVYTAVLDKPDMVVGYTELDHVNTNLRMLKHAFEAVELTGAAIENLTLMQGTKAYGVHLGPMKVPARERDPMHMPPSFYHAQQDYVIDRQRGQPWSWTIYRPQIVCGICPGAPLNLVSSLAVYCLISRELGLPLRFPANPYAGVVELIDARIIARAIEWGMSNPAASANEIFNLANGDIIDWNNLFPRLARHFKMELDRPQPIPLQAMMEDKEPIWNRIVKKYDLEPLSYADVKGSWQAVDFVLRMGNAQPPPICSTIKLRKAGFHECCDSEDMILDYISEMQSLRHIAL
jgi:nucleoside-diphosphate-sugar epimerase